jgi:antitoxin Phd
VSTTWKLQDAKNRFSEVVNEAQQSGPQIVTRRGKETAVVMSMKDYRELVRPEIGLVEFLRSSPLHGEDLDFDRPKDLSREIDL